MKCNLSRMIQPPGLAINMSNDNGAGLNFLIIYFDHYNTVVGMKCIPDKYGHVVLDSMLVDFSRCSVVSYSVNEWIE